MDWPIAYGRVSQLYRYQQLSLKHLRTLLSSQLYFSNPLHFNDPWDCRPQYSSEGLGDQQWEAAVYGRLEKYRRKHFNCGLPTEFFQSYMENPTLAIGRWLEGYNRNILRLDTFPYRICCLSAKPDEPLMWAHYAANHGGYCLEFSTSCPIFGSAIEVKYVAVRDHLNFLDETPRETLKPIALKADRWSYESEYRIVAEEERLASEYATLRCSNGLASFPLEALTGIILGSRVPQPYQLLIRSMVCELAPHVKLYQALIKPEEYKMQIADL